jgi:hypothetical protein
LSAGRLARRFIGIGLLTSSTGYIEIDGIDDRQFDKTRTKFSMDAITATTPLTYLRKGEIEFIVAEQPEMTQLCENEQAKGVFEDILDESDPKVQIYRDRLYKAYRRIEAEIQRRKVV